MWNFVDVDLTLEIVSDRLNVHAGPGITFSKMVDKELKKGQKVKVVKEYNDWYQLETGGWFCSNQEMYAKIIGSTIEVKDVTEQVGTVEDNMNAELTSNRGQYEPTTTTEDTLEQIDNQLMDFNAYSYRLYENNMSVGNIKTIRGIHGMPYQFMSSTDIKLSELPNSGVDFPYGRVFTEKIINKMPLLLMSPGSPVFLDGFTEDTKTSIVTMMTEAMKGNESKLEELLNSGDNGRYYSFRFNYKDYYSYVNAMCQASAIYLGIGGKTLDGKPYRSYDWSTYVNSGLKGFFSGSEYVCFYVDAETQITDSFSNTTGESMLDTGLNKLSNLGQEIGFLLGAGAGIKIDALQTDNYDVTFEMVSEILGNYKDPQHIMNRLKEGGVTIAGGGQLIFPEIWKDSSYSKSYDMTIRLNSPDGDTESIYRNILIPLWHLMGLALPLQMGYNGFSSPFLIKAHYKGLINCEMGIITSMNIRKGSEGSWNIDGLPTEVEVSISFKDLYQILSLTKAKDVSMLVNNTQLMDFIATMCGIVLNKPEILRKIEIYSILQLNKVINLPTRVQSGLKQSISNILLRSIAGR